MHSLLLSKHIYFYLGNTHSDIMVVVVVVLGQLSPTSETSQALNNQSV